MSELVRYLRDAVENYIVCEIDIDKFREVFVGVYYHIRSFSPAGSEANYLASKLMGPFAEFCAGHRSEISLREELQNALGPFDTPKEKDMRQKVGRDRS